MSIALKSKSASLAEAIRQYDYEKFSVAATDSYDKHFGSTAVAAAESDALGEAIWQRDEAVELLRSFFLVYKSATTETDLADAANFLGRGAGRLLSIIDTTTKGASK